MDIWKYFDITHRYHILCNPTRLEKYTFIVSLTHLQPGARVLEIAAGKGEFITLLAERYLVSGVAIDASPYVVEEMKHKLADRVPRAQIEVLTMDAAEYRPEQPESFDLTACIGASWIFGDHRGTLAYLKEQTRPGGWIVVGEPFWRREPDPEYLQSAGYDRDSFSTHAGNVRIGEELGLRLAYTSVSNHDEWDMYECLQWYAAELYAREHPDDPDLPEVMQRVEKSRNEYLRWGRETMGWAIYVFLK